MGERGREKGLCKGMQPVVTRKVVEVRVVRSGRGESSFK